MGMGLGGTSKGMEGGASKGTALGGTSKRRAAPPASPSCSTWAVQANEGRLRSAPGAREGKQP